MTPKKSGHVEIKTKPTTQSVSGFLEQITDLQKRGDAFELMEGKMTKDRILSQLAYIGIYKPELRGWAVGIGEKLGIYCHYPVSKGCTSPFAPIWIDAIAARQKN